MSADIFVDTNILYYALTTSPDPRHELARTRVRELWQEPGRAALSVQVLQELHVNLLRKGGLSLQESARRIDDYFAWQVIDNDRALLRAALDAQERWRLSFWDSSILAAALRAGARTLWSEDFSTHQRFDGLTVVNPLERS